MKLKFVLHAVELLNTRQREKYQPLITNDCKYITAQPPQIHLIFFFLTSKPHRAEDGAVLSCDLNQASRSWFSPGCQISSFLSSTVSFSSLALTLSSPVSNLFPSGCSRQQTLLILWRQKSHLKE